MGVYIIGASNSLNTSIEAIADSQPSTVFIKADGSVVNAHGVTDYSTIYLAATSVVTVNGHVGHFFGGGFSENRSGAIQFVGTSPGGSVVNVGEGGSIFSYRSHAINAKFVTNLGVSITVNNAGTIQADGYDSIRCEGLTLNNSGVCGTVRSFSSSATVTNSGSCGAVYSNFAVVTNSGRLASVVADQDGGGTAYVTNAAGGSISVVRSLSLDAMNQGSIGTVIASYGRLHNSGIVNEVLGQNIGPNTNDYVVTNNGIIGSLQSGDGSGAFSYFGAQGTITGTASLGRDTNLFYGGAGSEKVVGSGGSDTVDLGGGNDSFSLGLPGGSGTVEGGLGADTIGSQSYYDPALTEEVVQAFVFNLTAGTVAESSGVIRYFISGFENVQAGTTNGLSGANDTIIGSNVANLLDGGGGNDTMTGGLGNDSYIVDTFGDKVNEVAGQGYDVVRAKNSYVLGAGQSIEYQSAATTKSTAALNLTGNEQAQVIAGNCGTNVLSGLAGNDRLFGFAGTDVLNGGIGNDVLGGGVGNDVFVFNSALNAATNIDTILDYSAADDTIRLENTGAGLFNALAVGTLAPAAFVIGAAATAAAHRIVYNSTTGALSYDADGSGAGAAVQFAQLSTGLGLTNADFVVI